MRITREDVESLVERSGTPGTNILSVYLNVDQSRASNLNRRFEATLKQMLRELGQTVSEEARSEFESAASLILRHVSGYTPRGRSLVLFAAGDRWFWQRELSISLPSKARWNDTPYVKPLVEALDEYGRYAVILTSQEEARLFTVFLGEIEEHREVFADQPVKRFKQTAKDNIRSDRAVERKMDERSLRHLKNVADVMDRLADERSFDRLVLAGSDAVTSELSKLLSKRLQARVVGSIRLPIDAAGHEVLAETQRIQEEVERSAETVLIEELITAASKQSQAVLGIDPVLDAWREGRVRRLVYAEGAALPGAECTNCGSLSSGEAGACRYCGSALRPVEDIVARLGDLVTASGGDVENVRGPAAERFRQVSGIGAFLRF